jgi:hypothetical protein
MGLSLLQDGSIATFSNLSDIFSHKEVFKLPLPAKRPFQRHVVHMFDPEIKIDNFKRQDPKTAEIYDVATYSIEGRDTSIEVSKINGV